MVAGLVLVSVIVAAATATSQAAGPVLNDPAILERMGQASGGLPLLAGDIARSREQVEASIRAGVNVPVPKDPGGGATHEQHRRNYLTIYGGGLLYRITGERRYAEHVRDLLLAYAKLYPTLGRHPAASNQVPGRLFWQSLNDSVWLVYAVQGYDAIRDTLSPADRAMIDSQLFRRMADFLSIETAANFDRIHNHATWAVAGVGMTGYVLRDRELVERALRGSDKSGKAGFLRQLDQLFSPDGYYAEGPYYQRYALQPFVLFADAIARNDRDQRIFAYRDGIILKAITTTIQLSYDGYFFPINDALPDKSLRTDELYQAVAIGHRATHDPSLLSIAAWQGHTVLTDNGLAVAKGVADGAARPFPFVSRLFRDGPAGRDGALAVLRSGPQETAQVLVAKNTAQGMGHGHFDRLNWLVYDNGQPIVTDYGAARFLNVEAKSGGRYLPENDSWAQQTVAHNTLVVNETSQFDAQLKSAEAQAPQQLYFAGSGMTQASTAAMSAAYPGVTFRRTLVQASVKGLDGPLVLDLLKVDGAAPATYDLPLHYAGQLIDTDLSLTSNLTTRPVLGTDFGYQHLWVDATAAPVAGSSRITWMTGNRFYTYRMATPGAEILLVESGANDPQFNLRREPAIIQRLRRARDATFVSLLEPHGSYDPSSEIVTGSASAVSALDHVRGKDADAVIISLKDGRRLILGVADDPGPTARHSMIVHGQPFDWTGHIGRSDRIEGQ